ncbi:MAG: hypothetical protein AAGA48_36955 [Myxococcota bacterium]
MRGIWNRRGVLAAGVMTSVAGFPTRAQAGDVAGQMQPYPDWEDGWFDPERSVALSDLLGQLARHDARGALWCGVLCAETVHPLLPTELQDEGRVILDLATDWARGLPVDADIQEFAALRRPSHFQDIRDRLSRSERCAVESVYTLLFFHQHMKWNGSLEEPSIWAIGRNAARAHAWLGRSTLGEADVLPFSRGLLALVVDQLTPAAPTMPPTAPRLKAIWGWLMEVAPEPRRTGTLGAALGRTAAWGLERCGPEGWDPHERAVAERLATPPPGWTLPDTPGPSPEERRVEKDLDARRDGLVDLLEHRFGRLTSRALHFVRQGRQAQLDRWSERALDPDKGLHAILFHRG